MPSRPLSTRYALDHAMEQLSRAMAQADARRGQTAAEERQKEPELAGVDAALVDAVRQRDAEAVRAALKAGADANAGQGKSLQVAAEQKNAALMKELVIRGAEVSVAVAGLRAEKKLLEALAPAAAPDDPEVRNALRGLLAAVNPQAGRLATDRELSSLIAELGRQHRDIRRMRAEDARRCQQNDATLKTLEDWQANFLKAISPLDILRQQQKILDDLDALKRELLPRTLDKPKLPAPKPAPPRNG